LSIYSGEKKKNKEKNGIRNKKSFSEPVIFINISSGEINLSKANLDRGLFLFSYFYSLFHPGILIALTFSKRELFCVLA